MRRTIATLLLMATGCAPLVGSNYQPPTDDQIARADYGPRPQDSQTPDMLRRYWKVRHYFDPNGAEIESCSPFEKSWIRDTEPRRATDHVYGWKTSCDVNGKNLFGVHAGFRRYDFLARDGEIVRGDNPHTPGTNILGGIVFR